MVLAVRSIDAWGRRRVACQSPPGLPGMGAGMLCPADTSTAARRLGMPALPRVCQAERPRTRCAKNGLVDKRQALSASPNSRHHRNAGGRDLQNPFPMGVASRVRGHPVLAGSSLHSVSQHPKGLLSVQYKRAPCRAWQKPRFGHSTTIASIESASKTASKKSIRRQASAAQQITCQRQAVNQSSYMPRAAKRRRTDLLQRHAWSVCHGPNLIRETPRMMRTEAYRDPQKSALALSSLGVRQTRKTRRWYSRSAFRLYQRTALQPPDVSRAHGHPTRGSVYIRPARRV